MKRLQRSQQLLERLPNEKSVRSIWFIETTFTIDTILKNDRVYSVETKKRQVPERTLVREREHAAKVSRYQLVYLEWGSLGDNCEVVLKRGLLPVIQATCGRHDWTLQQDRAPSYTSRNTINFLQENVNFIEPDKWPANSPD